MSICCSSLYLQINLHRHICPWVLYNCYSQSPSSCLCILASSTLLVFSRALKCVKAVPAFFSYFLRSTFGWGGGGVSIIRFGTCTFDTFSVLLLLDLLRLHHKSNASMSRQSNSCTLCHTRGWFVKVLFDHIHPNKLLDPIHAVNTILSNIGDECQRLRYLPSAWQLSRWLQARTWNLPVTLLEVAYGR